MEISGRNYFYANKFNETLLKLTRCKMGNCLLNAFAASFDHHIETSQFIFHLNQITNK